MSDTDLFFTDYCGWFPFNLKNPFIGNPNLAAKFSVSALVKIFWLLKSYGYSTSANIVLSSRLDVSGGSGDSRGRGVTYLTAITITGVAGRVYVATGFDTTPGPTLGDPLYLPPCAARSTRSTLPAQIPSSSDMSTNVVQGAGSYSGTLTEEYSSGATNSVTDYSPSPIGAPPPAIFLDYTSLGWLPAFVAGALNHLAITSSQFKLNSQPGAGYLTIFDPTDPTQGPTRVGSSNLVLQCGTETVTIPLTLILPPPIEYVAAGATATFSGNILTLHGSGLGGPVVSGPGYTGTISAPIFDGDTILFNAFGQPPFLSTVTAVGGLGDGDTITMSSAYSGVVRGGSVSFYNLAPAPVITASSTGDIVVDFDTFWP